MPLLRVVLSGVESVGKSVLAEAIADRFGGVLVPEYGRGYTERLDRPLEPRDLHAIADGHRFEADAAAERSPRLLVEDTDIVMTTAWGTMLFGGRDPALAALPSAADLHLLLLPDVPFVADPVRMFGAPGDRAAFHAIIEEEFAARGLKPVRIGGPFQDRTAAALAVVGERLQ
jgi:NadR type nicotinamide-nucleotide adenylyltransferase